MGAMLTTRTAMIAGCVAASAGLVWYGVHRWSTNRAHRARIGTSDVFSIALPDAKMTKYSVRRRGSKGACTEEYAGMHKIWCIIHVLHANSGSFPREDAVYSKMGTLCSYLNMTISQAYNDSKLDEARDLATQAIDLDPSNYKYYNNRAVVYLKLLQFRKAYTDSSKALRLGKAIAHVRDLFVADSPTL